MESDEGDYIGQWKIKRLIKNLDQARGNGTSLVSLIIPPREQLSLYNKLITDEYGKAANIKSRVVRQSVQSAMTSVRERLRLYNRTPNNGLIIYCGEVLNDQGNIEKKVTIDLEPFKPINTSLYLCDSVFHTEVLKELLETDQKFGFIIMDGNGSLFGTLQGNTREILYQFGVDLPKKHGRGGQSALRFARLRMEKRHNYIRRVGEHAVQHFITNDKVNVTGLVLAGSAEFKKELSMSDLLDGRLQAKILKIVDVAYGGENGFNQAIELSLDTLQDVKFLKEKRLVSALFDNIAQDTRRFVFGVQDTMKALELGAVETLMIYENLDYIRITTRLIGTQDLTVHLLRPNEESKFSGQGGEMEIVDKTALSEWMVENYKKFGAVLEFITNKSPEGAQFVKGFGGIGGLLRYELDLMQLAPDDEEEEEFDDEFM